MKRLLLIHGDPGSGKTPLGQYLRREYSFEILSLDDLYVKFVEEECPDFYFKKLRNYISQHYHQILDNRGYTEKKFGRNLVKEWHEYLFNTIFSNKADNLIVEGYLLVDCIDDIEIRMSQITQVHQVQVKNGSYTVSGRLMTADDIAILNQVGKNVS